MNTLVKILSSSLDASKRILKVLRMGTKDVQTANESAPYGFDSVPIKDVIAVFAPTTQLGKTVVIGYINKNQKAESGEVRFFSTDDDGVEKFYAWLKKDGTMEIGGDQNNAVKFTELKTEFNKLKSDFNDLVSKFNSHTHILALTAGTGTAAVTASPASSNTSDIDSAKNDKIKTI